MGTSFFRSLAAVVTLATTLLTSQPVLASSHREAPLVARDPEADPTDVYAFRSPDNPNAITLIANFLPFQEPAGGPNFYTFDDSVLYEIKVDNDGDAKEDLSYQFRFTTTREQGNTFLYGTGPIGSLSDPDFNIRQHYTLTREPERGRATVLGTNLATAPSNVGPHTTPDYAALQAGAVHSLANGIKVFAGQSDDPFFVDLGGIFDLLTIRNAPGDTGGGVDGLRGYNVHSLALQIPISQLTRDGSVPTDLTNPASVIGVWTTSSRQSMRVLNHRGEGRSSGRWVQVGRLGNPLVNEVVVALQDKDQFNISKPKDDEQFANYVANPELGTLLNVLYGIVIPPQGDFGTANQRDDLIAIFLTGLPGLTNSGVTEAAEEMRLNLAVPVSSTPNRLGVIAGDNQGFPNGRRLGDDVVDIELRAIAGAVYPLFHAGFTPDATGVRLGDGVDANDMAFGATFPYLALPHNGFDSRPHPAP